MAGLTGVPEAQMKGTRARFWDSVSFTPEGFVLACVMIHHTNTAVFYYRMPQSRPMQSDGIWQPDSQMRPMQRSIFTSNVVRSKLSVAHFVQVRNINIDCHLL